MPTAAEASEAELYAGPNGLFRLLGWILITALGGRRPRLSAAILFTYQFSGFFL